MPAVGGRSSAALAGADAGPGATSPSQIASVISENDCNPETAAQVLQACAGSSWRNSLPANGGMLFVYPDTPVVEMWMANTYLALDMVFIAPTGHIDSLAQQLAPHASGDFSLGRPTLAVLELAGGSAARLGFKPGDEVVCDALTAAQPAPPARSG